MHLTYGGWCLAVPILVLLLGVYSATGVEVEHTDHTAVKHKHDSSSHMDPSILVFFTLSDLKVGKVIPVYFRGTNPSHFLPREEAEAIPFKLSELHVLLDHFAFRRGSSQAKAMEDTLRECEVAPIKGETKHCATSLESMLDFVHKILGLTTQVSVLSTRHFAKSSNNVLQNYTIVDEPLEILAPKLVACHTMPYPYVIYYCHYQQSESKVFQVALRGEDGSKVEAVALCHMDTSQWSQSHVSFGILGTKPGSSPVCHFFPSDNLVWVSLLKTGEGVQDNYKVAQM